MYCVKCGNRLEDGAKFCNNCGNQIGEISNNQYNENDVIVKNNSSKITVLMK